MDNKNKKKTLTISSTFKKKIDTTSVNTSGKKAYSVGRKKFFKSNKGTNKSFRHNDSKLPDLNKKRILLENLLNNKQQKHLLKKRR